MRWNLLALICTFVAVLNPAVVYSQAAANYAIDYESNRHAYMRGETVNLEIKVSNHSSQTIRNISLSIDIGEVIQQKTVLGKISGNSSKKCLFRVNTGLLKEGDYRVQCTLKQESQILHQESFPFWVTKKINPDRVPLWLWPNTPFVMEDGKLSAARENLLAWYCDKGFDVLTIYDKTDKGQIDMLDYYLRHGCEVTFYGTGLMPSKEDTDPALKYDGRNERGKLLDPFHPEVAKIQNETVRNQMQVLRHFPQVKYCFLNSEVTDFIYGLQTPYSKHYAADYSPAPVKHEFVLPGVIPDNDEKYVRWMKCWKWADGLSVALKRAADKVHAYRPDIVCLNDPARRSAVYGRFSGMDVVSTWTYSNPDPKGMLFIETLIAAGKPFNQGVINTVTALNYPGEIAPKDKGWTVIGPDRLVETSWINLSRRPDALSIFISSGLRPFIDTGPETKEPYMLYPKTWEALKVFSNETVKPYGAMIRKLDRTPRRVAVLSSESSNTYRNSPILMGHYGNLQIYHFYTLLNMAHISADVIFDETILEFGLDDYDVLVLPKCDTLLKTVYDKILAFQERGGLVISDQYLRAPVTDVEKFDFDFTYRKKVSVNAILENKTYADWNDLVGHNIENAEFKEVKGVTAMDDQKIMESYAAKLRKGLEGKVKRQVDCSSPTALLNTLEKGNVKYLFVINDKRVYGERFGKYKGILEKAVPQTVTITLNDWPYRDLYLYDILEKKVLEYKSLSGGHTFDVDLPAPGGKIIMMLPVELASVEIGASAKIAARGCPYDIQVLLKDTKGGLLPGIQPVKVQIKDPEGNVSGLSDYYAAENGILKLDFVPALNDIAGKW